jgi:hypothetical protein
MAENKNKENRSLEILTEDNEMSWMLRLHESGSSSDVLKIEIKKVRTGKGLVYHAWGGTPVKSIANHHDLDLIKDCALVELYGFAEKNYPGVKIDDESYIL